MTWKNSPWTSADASLLRSKQGVIRFRNRLQKWLDEHPDPEPKSFRTSLYEAFGRLFGFYTPPPIPTAEEMAEEVTKEAMEITTKAWVKAHIQLCDELLEEMGGSDE